MRLPLFSLHPVFSALRPAALVLTLLCGLWSFPYAASAVPGRPASLTVSADAADALLPEAAVPAAPTIRAVYDGLALTPFLQYLTDPQGEWDIDAVSGERSAEFLPYDTRRLFRKAGSTWLRFRLDPLPGAGPLPASAQAMLDLGDQVPGQPRVWLRPGGDARTQPLLVEPDDAGLFPLTALSGGGDVFVRLDGLPGLWFTPALRTLSQAVVAPERRVHPLILAALTALLLLCLVRSVTERGDGRLWAGIFTGAALLHALWGVPATPRGAVIPWDMPGLLAAGVALMLLPHVGRNIMRTRDTSPCLDMVLLILALPGAALAVLPLLPDMAWTARLLTLWPLGAALALAPALLLLLRGVSGSGLFTLACLGMVGGGVLALWGVDGSLAGPLWAQGPLAGVTFASLLLAAAAPRSAYAEPEADSSGDVAPHGALLPSPHILPETAWTSGADPAQVLRLEEILRPPLDTLLREACSLDQALERPSGRLDAALTGQEAQRARRHADNLVAAARELTALVTDLPRLGLRQPRPENVRQPFDLLRLIRQVFADVEKELTDKDLGLSWYIAPHLGLRYKGDRDRLRFVLTMLLTDAVRATAHGAVSLRVRRADMSPNPGHLQFTVADTGTGTPPLRRSSLALAKAWELASEHQGDLFVDSTPAGVEITLSLDCATLAKDGLTALPVPPQEVAGRRDGVTAVTADPRLVILTASRPLDRQLLAFFLEDQGQTIWEARDAEEAVALYTHTPSALVVFDGHLPEEDIVTAIAAIRVFEGERALPAVPFLGLTLDENQAERLHQAGCDHSLPLPVVRGEFRAMALYLASPSGAKPRPAIVPHRVPPNRFLRTRTAGPAEARDSGGGALGPQTAPHRDLPVEEPPSFLPLELRPAPGPASAADIQPPAEAGSQPAAQPSPDSIAAPSQDMTPNPARIGAGGITTKNQRPDATRTPLSPTHPRKETASQPQTGHPTPAKHSGPATPHPAPAPTPAQGLLIPPAPPRGLGRLAALFKPTPKVPPPLPEESIPSATEWVGEPMPVPSAPKKSLDQTPDETGLPDQLLPTGQNADQNAEGEARTDTPASATTERLYKTGESMEMIDAEADPLPQQPTASASSPQAMKDVEKDPEVDLEEDGLDSAPSAMSGSRGQPWAKDSTGAAGTVDPSAASEALSGSAADIPAQPLAETPTSAKTAGKAIPLPPPSQETAIPLPPPSAVMEAESSLPVPEVQLAVFSGLPAVRTDLTSLPVVNTEQGKETEEAREVAPAALPMPGAPEDAAESGMALSPPEPDEGKAAPREPLAALDRGKPATPPGAGGLAVPDVLSSPGGLPPVANLMEQAAPHASASVPPPPARQERRDPGSRARRKKSRLDDLPFLSLDPNYMPAFPTDPQSREALSLEPATATAMDAVTDREEADDIVELTEEDMVDSPLLQQVPDLLRSLDATVEHAAVALAREDAWGLVNAADRMADRAVAFGLHALSDLALCLKEAAQNRDFDAAAQLLPDLRAEVDRHRAL